MRVMIRALIALIFVLLPIHQIAAQGSEQDRVEVVFRLTLYGRVPAGEQFRLGVAEPGHLGDTVLCGDPDFPSDPRCTGERNMYTTGYASQRGDSSFSYSYSRIGVGAAQPEYFAGRQQAFSEYTTVSAYYEYDEHGRPVGGGFGDGPPGMATVEPQPTPTMLPLATLPPPTQAPESPQPVPTALVPEVPPDVGGGPAGSGTGMLFGVSAAVVTLVLVGGYLGVRRRGKW